MTIQINIARAKAELSELIALAEAGEEVIIARDGVPVVTLTPRNPAPRTGPRPLGLWAHIGPLTDPDLFLRPDATVEALTEAPIFPVE